MGAILSQSHLIDDEYKLLPIAYASRVFKASQKNYSTTDKEGLVVIWAVKNFKPYIYGMKFTIITDYLALKALKEKANLKGQLVCWAEYLAS